MSNRLMKVFEETNRDWNNEKLDSDEFLLQMAVLWILC